MSTKGSGFRDGAAIGNAIVASIQWVLQLFHRHRWRETEDGLWCNDCGTLRSRE